MTKDEVIKKIKKCLKLSASCNEHEAETALRQARALMEKYGIDDTEMAASDAAEAFAKSGSKLKPNLWETHLANRIAKSFGCDLIFSGGYSGGRWLFIGVEPAPEIAGYTFGVLYRQCKKARALHIKTHLKRCSPATTVRRADLFCQGWVAAVTQKINALVPGEKQQAAIAAFIAYKHTDMTTLKAKDRNDGRKLGQRDLGDLARGLASGKDAELNRGVNTQANAGLLQ